MTWPEVASDAIKIGVPSLLTGVMAFVIARSSRSHEMKKERRKQFQGVMEQLVRRLAAMHSSTHKHWLFKKDEVFKLRESSRGHLEEALEVAKSLDRHTVDIQECRAILLLLGVDRKGPSLSEYFDAVMAVHEAFQRVPPPTMEEIGSLQDQVEMAYTKLIIQLGVSFRKL